MPYVKQICEVIHIYKCHCYGLTVAGYTTNNDDIRLSCDLAYRVHCNDISYILFCIKPR